MFERMFLKRKYEKIENWVAGLELLDVLIFVYLRS